MDKQQKQLQGSFRSQSHKVGPGWGKSEPVSPWHIPDLQHHIYTKPLSVTIKRQNPMDASLFWIHQSSTLSKYYDTFSALAWLGVFFKKTQSGEVSKRQREKPLLLFSQIWRASTETFLWRHWVCLARYSAECLQLCISSRARRLGVPAKGNTTLVPRTLSWRSRRRVDLEETTVLGPLFFPLHKFLVEKFQDPNGYGLLRLMMVLVCIPGDP